MPKTTTHSATWTASLLGLLLFAQGGRAELVAHFPFDGDAIDKKGGREGLVGEGVTFRTTGGKLGGAAEFEGIASHPTGANTRPLAPSTLPS